MISDCLNSNKIEHCHRTLLTKIQASLKQRSCSQWFLVFILGSRYFENLCGPLHGVWWEWWSCSNVADRKSVYARVFSHAWFWREGNIFPSTFPFSSTEDKNKSPILCFCYYQPLGHWPLILLAGGQQLTSSVLQQLKMAVKPSSLWSSLYVIPFPSDKAKPWRLSLSKTNLPGWIAWAF